MLVAVCCQGVQFVTQLVPVVKLEVLEQQTQKTMTVHSRPTKENEKACPWTHAVRVSGELEQKGDRLPGSDSHVDVVALQQLRQFGQVPANQTPLASKSAGASRTAQKLLLAQDVVELTGCADGEQQRPGQQRVGVELAGLGGD